MANRTAVLTRCRRTLILLLTMIGLVLPAAAQHGGGGGHAGGGHFGGGHSSGGHTSAAHTGGHHWGWLHFRFSNRSARRVGAAIKPRTGAAPIERLPSTYIQPTPLRFTSSAMGKAFSVCFAFRHHPSFFFGRFPSFPSSGCFFNGFNQVCFFEPVLPLFFFSSSFDGSLANFGIGGEAIEESDKLVSADTTPAGSSVDADSSVPSGLRGGVNPAPQFRGQGLDRRFFLLIQKSGIEHVVTDYWLVDGYIEYVSPDGTRSHIPVEALDLQETVVENSRRGLSFVLQSPPEDRH